MVTILNFDDDMAGAINKGSPFLYTYQVTPVVNLTTFTAKMQIRRTPTSPIISELSTTNGKITLTSQGLIILHIPQEETTVLDAGQYNYDLKVIDVNGNTMYIIRGVAYIIENITDSGGDNIPPSHGKSYAFKTIRVPTQPDIVADDFSDVLNINAGANINITSNAVTDTLTISVPFNFAPSAEIDTTDASNITSGVLDPDRLPLASETEVGGVRIDGETIIINTNGEISAVNTGGGSQDTFKTISVPGKDDVVANSPDGTLTISPGIGISIDTIPEDSQINIGLTNDPSDADNLTSGTVHPDRLPLSTTTTAGAVIIDGETIVSDTNGVISSPSEVDNAIDEDETERAPSQAAVAGELVIRPTFDEVENIVKLNHLPRTLHVSKNGDDTDGNGSITNPFLTIQKAADVIGAATSSADFLDASKQFYKIEVDGGVYTENVTFGTRPHILLDLGSARLVGDLTLQFAQGTIYGGDGAENYKFSITGDDLRPISGISHTGIQGNIYAESIAGGTGLFLNLSIKNIGITGDIVQRLGVGGGNFTVGLYLDRAIYLGDIINQTASSNTTLYASNSNYSGSNALGGVQGRVLVYQLNAVRFNRPIVTSLNHSGANWYNVIFSSVAHNFTGASGTVSADAATITSWNTAVPSKGSIVMSSKDHINSTAGIIDPSKLPVATPSLLGAVKIDNDTITIDGNGVISANVEGGGGGSNEAYNVELIGTVNGVDTIFTTPDDFVANSTRLFMNGLRLKLGEDYTESDINEISFSTAPEITDTLLVDYTKS